MAHLSLSLIHIYLCTNSSFEKGLCFSDKYLNLLNELKAFNYKNIYFCDRIQPSIRYFEVVLNEIYNILKSYYSKDLQTSLNKLCHVYPKLGNSFKGFVNLFYDFGDRTFCKNTILFSSNNEKDFYHCILSVSYTHLFLKILLNLPSL